jgi:hypothetical protein
MIGKLRRSTVRVFGEVGHRPRWLRLPSLPYYTLYFA